MSDEGVHIQIAAHEVVSGIDRFCELAKDDPRYAAAEANDLRLAAFRLLDALILAKNSRKAA